MKKIALILITILSFISIKTNAQDILVSNISEYNNAIKSAKAGTIIILENGIWKDVKLNAYGKGEDGNPIIVKAETAGEVIISGNSTLNIYGEYIIVSGLWFKDGNSSYKSVVQFRKDKTAFGNNCRFTNSTISYYKVDDGIKDHWVDIWGNNNRVDHNNFTGKISPGTTLVVWLKGEEHIENNHRIDNNLFGARPELGINGGETIRIGTSTNSKKSSKTLVERNVFAGCDGEIEIISNKSGDNIFRDNLFVGSKGCLTLRHGDNALVERNVFLGNGVSKTGGIRVINSGHIIRNNLMVGLLGDGYRGSIVLMNGVPNSPLNRYEQVRNVDIQNNTIINSGPIYFGEGKDDEKSLAPKNVNFSNNIFFHDTATENVITVDEASDINFSNNYIDAKGTSANGFKATKINWKEIKRFPIPTAANNDLLIASKNSKSPEKDITKVTRKAFNAGAFNLDAKKLPKALSLRAGPGWKPEIIAPIIKPKDIIVEPGIETLRKALGKAAPGSTLRLKTGEYILEKTIKINKDIIIEGDKGGASILTAKENLEKPISYFFRINEGYKMTLSNVIIDGEASNPKYAIVSPDKKEDGLYSVFVDNVVFKNFTNKNGGSIFKAYNGTKADTLSFKNSRFENSYRGLNLSYDKDIMGFYNANVIVLDNSVFKDLEEAAVNYIRTTPSEDIPGGKLIVNNCVFSNVYNNEKKGIVLKTNGISAVEITNSVFYDSYKIKAPVVLKGRFNFISNCLIHKSGFAKVSKGAKKEDVLYKKPKWDDENLFIPSKKSLLLKVNNDKERIGLKE
jgi:poly(beta-D-mannuronate) lyase